MGEIKESSGSLLSLVQNRLSLFAVEVQMEKFRLFNLLLTGLLALFFLGFGILFIVFAIVLAFWEVYGLWVLGGFALVFLIIGALFVWSAYRQKLQPSALFTTSLRELRKDQGAIDDGDS